MYLKPDTCPPIASIQAAEIIEHLFEFGPTVNFNWVLSLSAPELIVGIWSKHCLSISDGSGTSLYEAPDVQVLK